MLSPRNRGQDVIVRQLGNTMLGFKGVIVNLVIRRVQEDGWPAIPTNPRAL